MKHVLLAVAFFSLIGCASINEDFVFDGSSAQSIQSDIEYVISELPRSKRTEFIIALLSIQFSDVTSVKQFIGDPAMMEPNYDILRKKLDGLTYQQALQLAEETGPMVRRVK